MRVNGNSFNPIPPEQLYLLNARKCRLQNQAAAGQSTPAPEEDPIGTQQLQAATVPSSLLEELKTIPDPIRELLLQASQRKAALETAPDSGVARANFNHTLIELSHTRYACQSALQSCSKILNLDQSLLSAVA
jgi:hypothetical protein